MNSIFTSMKRQSGISLMEVTGSLIIIGMVISGALALFASADTSQKTNQLQTNVFALQSAVRSLYAGSGTYTTGAMNAVLVAAHKIPSTMTVNSDAAPVISHGLNGGTVTVTGGGTTFSIVLTALPQEICIALLTGATSAWSSVKANAGTALTVFPVTPATASGATYCVPGIANTVTFTGA